jgi:carbon monoxide dehydrogenase subunit G
VLMDQSSRDDTLGAVGPPRSTAGEAVSSQSSRDKDREPSPAASSMRGEGRAIRVEGERDFQAPRATVWQVLNDPAQMAKLMPGVQSFEIQDDRHWRAHVKIPLGPGAMKMSIDFEKTEEREPEFAKLHAKGNGVGAIMNMDTSFHLSEGGSGGTHMKWDAEVHILGPVASMGQRVLQPIVNQQVGQVLGALEKQVQEAAQGPAGAEEGTTSSTEDKS